MNTTNKISNLKGIISTFIAFAAIFFLTIAPLSVFGELITVAPPDVFTLPGSETNIVRVCTLGDVLNIVIDVTGKNTIEFQEPIVDMCDNDTVENLDQYFKMDTVGEVTVDSRALPYLKDKSALITMRNLPFGGEPDIEVDGNQATDQDIENKSWDKYSKTITFKAKHFTVYKAVNNPSSPLDQIEPSQTEETKQLMPSVGYAPIIVIIIFAAVGLAGYLIRRKKRSS